MILTHELFAEIGQALFGSDWEAEMARELRRSRKTIQRWRNGKTKRIDPKIRGILLMLIEKRRIAINTLWSRIGGR